MPHCPARQVSKNKKSTKSTPHDPRGVERLYVLASLNLPPEVLFPELFPRLRRLVPAATCTAYWRGANQFLAHCYEESDSRVRFSPPSIDTLRNLRSLIAHVDAARGLATAGGFHCLSVPIHRAGEIAGFMCLHRPTSVGSFGVDEQAAVIRLARAMVINPVPSSGFADGPTAPLSAGVFAFNDTGLLVFACDDAQRALRLAGFESAEHAVCEIPAELPSRVSEHGSFRWEHRSACGRFEFSARRMQGGAAQPSAMLVTISHHAPVELTVLRNAETLGFTPKQSTVALAVARGDSYDAIASRLNIRPNTAVDHVRNLQTRLNARNRAELITRLVAG